MIRPMTSSVSALSGIVANGHQAMHLVSSAPSKIPYGGFSPVRLQTRLTPRPPSPGCLSGLWAVTVGISFPGVLSVVGLSSNRHRELLTSTAGPVALGSPFGYSVRTVHRLLWPHPRLWASVPASWLFPTRPRTPEVPQFTPRVFFGSCRFPYPGGFRGCTRLFLRHECWLRRLCTGSPTASADPPVWPAQRNEAADFTLWYDPIHR